VERGIVGEACSSGRLKPTKVGVAGHFG
jgi:hypothetical protein